MTSEISPTLKGTSASKRRRERRPSSEKYWKVESAIPISTHPNIRIRITNVNELRRSAGVQRVWAWKRMSQLRHSPCECRTEKETIE